MAKHTLKYAWPFYNIMHERVNIFICDLFSIMNKLDFISYADDNTPYVIGYGVKEVINSLKEASGNSFYWFAGNHIKANSDKCHLLVSSSDEVSICVDNYNIKSKKSGQKLNALFKSYPLHRLIKTTYTVKCIFHFTIRFLFISSGVS